MSTIRITKRFSFEAGHALHGYDGKCKNLHGHSYKLSVTVIGTPITDKTNPKFGMVIDFTDLKRIVTEEIVNKFDHATIFNKNTPHVKLAKTLKDEGHNVLLVDYQPTTECMIADFATKIKERLPIDLKLHTLKLQETESSYAEWVSTDNN
jgi:6-pyruvoyltetrahydropterin/6-carboxytetrahydropterin synthase